MSAVLSAAMPHLAILQVVVPLIAAMLAGFLGSGRLAFALMLVVSFVLPFIAGGLLWQVFATGPISYHIGGWAPPFGIEYRIDLLNAFVLMLITAVGAVMAPFAARSVASEIEDDKQAWFYCMYLLCIAGLLGITATGDAFNAFVFLEISSLSTYVLIAMGRDRRALVAAYQYLIMGTIGATFYVIGIGILYLLTGSLNLFDVAARLAAVPADQAPAIYAALAFITVGISLKLALFPLHAWLPNAYAYAPSWATAFLAATATKVAIYLLIRYYYPVFGAALDLSGLPFADIIVVLSVLAMFVASLIAVYEKNIERMLAFSSVAQIGYITLGIGLANWAGLTGGLVHLVNHALMKAALFLAMGAVVYRIGSTRIDDLAGIGRKMPLTMIAFTIAGFGLIGTPGTSGFISKWYLALGAVDRGWWPLVFLLVGSSLIAFVYVGRVLEVVWLRAPSPKVADAKDPPLSMLIPILIFAAATVWFGFDTQWTVGIAQAAAQFLLGGVR